MTYSSERYGAAKDSWFAHLAFEIPGEETGLRWFYWHARLSVNFAIDRWVVGVGYALSDLDYYSARRDVTLPGGTKFHVPAKELSQSVFISLGYSF